MTEIPSAADVARRLADELDRRGIPYAVGGAIALGFYAPPRATIDVDVNVFLPLEELGRVLDALRAAGFVAEKGEAALRDEARREGQFRGGMEGVRVDVFVPAIPYYRELETRRRKVRLKGRPLWILGAEDLVVLKLMFHRRKDVADAEAVLRELGDTLDLSLIRRKLTELAGPNDERQRTLEELVRDVGTGPDCGTR